MHSTRKHWIRRVLAACLVLAAGWLGYQIYLTAPLAAGWQLWSFACVVLLISAMAMTAWLEGEDPEGTSL